MFLVPVTAVMVVGEIKLVVFVLVCRLTVSVVDGWELYFSHTLPSVKLSIDGPRR